MPSSTPRELRTFAAVADALLEEGPEGLGVGTASELGIGDRLPELVSELPNDDSRQEFIQLLRTLGTRWGGYLLYRRATAFSDLDPAEAQLALVRMATSRLPLARRAFQALKRSVAKLVSLPPPGENAPAVWARMSYPGPDGPPPTIPKPVEVTEITSDTTLTADVVIVGSGAGGGVAAGILTEAGLDVVVCERGGYRNESDFTHREADAYPQMYLQGLQSATTDLGVALVAGATLGGGTVVNYTTSFPTPDGVRHEWDRVAGFDRVFSGSDYEVSSKAVQSRLGVNSDHTEPSRRDRILEDGARKLGWHVDSQPRNVVGCDPEACGYCSMGCRIGAKQSTLLTYLADAAEAGARFVTEADVRHVTTANGRATGVEATVDGNKLKVRAPTVVLAAGGLETPAVLLRSGLGGPSVGRHLRLHPVAAVLGEFNERVELWTGTIQTRYSDQFADLDGRGYGVKFETGAVHPLLFAALLTWEPHGGFQRDLTQYPYFGGLGVLLRDRSTGRVTLDDHGEPRWKYRLSNADQSHMREGLRRGAQLLREAGAGRIRTTSAVSTAWEAGHGTLDEFMARLDSIGYGPNQTAYFSWHQMGSARMGTDQDASVVDRDSQVHGTPGLYVMDASTFPTASGVNPMISIQTIAHRAASALAARLT